MEFKEFADKFIWGGVVLAYDINSKEKIRYMWREDSIKFTTAVNPQLVDSSFTLEDLYDCVCRDSSHWTIIDKFSKRCLE